MDKLEDLVVGDEYFVCFSDKPTFYRKGRLVSVHNDGFGTVAYFEFKESENEIPVGSIGIGKTRLEAKKDYGKLKQKRL